MLPVTKVLAVTLVPPVAAVYQATKVWPVLAAGVGNVPTAALKFRFTLGGSDGPPFALNDTVKLWGVHLAVNVSFLVIRVVVASLVPEALNQPSNV